jgi:hypothetical protein
VPAAGTPKYTISGRHEAARGRYRANGIFIFDDRRAGRIFPMNHKDMDHTLTGTEAVRRGRLAN